MVTVRLANGFRASLPPRDPGSYVYAAWDGEYVKVGRTAGHPIERVRCLSTGNPRPLRLLAYTAEAGRVTERRVHCLLSAHRVRGEWFVPTPAVLDLISGWDWVDTGLLREVRTAAG